MRRIGLIGEKAPPRPYFEGCRVYGDRIKSGIMNKQSSALTHREHNKEMIRGERLEMNNAEREVFHRILQNAD